MKWVISKKAYFQLIIYLFIHIAEDKCLIPQVQTNKFDEVDENVL